jgi:hypothetical protein
MSWPEAILGCVAVVAAAVVVIYRGWPWDR